MRSKTGPIRTGGQTAVIAVLIVIARADKEERIEEKDDGNDASVIDPIETAVTEIAVIGSVVIEIATIDQEVMVRGGIGPAVTNPAIDQGIMVRDVIDVSVTIGVSAMIGEGVVTAVSVEVVIIVASAVQAAAIVDMDEMAASGIARPIVDVVFPMVMYPKVVMVTFVQNTPFSIISLVLVPSVIPKQRSMVVADIAMPILATL